MNQINNYKQTPNLKFYYLFALILIALLVTVSYGVLHQLTVSQETAARLINTSGRQRMLSQRIALLATLLASTDDEGERNSIRTELSTRITEMSSNHNILVSPAFGFTTSPQIYALYFEPPLEVDKEIKNYLAAAVKVIQLPDSQLSTMQPDIMTLVSSNSVLLASLDSIVTEYEIEKKAEIVTTERFEFTILIVTLFLLLIETLVIFRPMERRILQRETQLKLEIEQREKAQIALRHSEAIYRLVVSNMPNAAVLMFDHDLRFTLADGPFLEAAGYKKHLMEGKTIQDVLAPAAYEAFVPYYRATLQGESISIERDRGDIAYTSEFVPVKDENNQTVGGMVVSSDITSRKRAEDALRASEERFRKLAAHAPIGIFQLDTNDKYIFVNPRWGQITGLTPEKGEPAKISSLIHPEDRDMVLKLWAGKDQSIDIRMKEFRLQKPDGEVIWVQVNIVPFHDLYDKVIGYIGTLTDISERKKAEQELEESHDFIKNITEATPDLIYLYDIVEQQVVYTNHDIGAFLGYALIYPPKN